MKFNKLIPELSVSDLNRSIRFYTEVLGFRIEYQREESKFAFLSFEGSQIMVQDMSRRWDTGKLERPFGRGVNFQIDCKDIEPLVKSLKKYNHPLFEEPKDSWYRQDKKLLGCREFLVQDPDGYLLRFSQDIGSKPI